MDNNKEKGMEARFTPGPWTFSTNDQWGDKRFYVAQQEGAPYTPNYSDVATLIAETVSVERVAIQEANAHLIAAAPELLEALKLFVWPHQEGSRHTDTERQEIGRAVISKATGAS
jgi:hypothetical protein